MGNVRGVLPKAPIGGITAPNMMWPTVPPGGGRESGALCSGERRDPVSFSLGRFTPELELPLASALGPVVLWSKCSLGGSGLPLQCLEERL